MLIKIRFIAVPFAIALHRATEEHNGGTRAAAGTLKNRKLVPFVYDTPPAWPEGTRPCGPDLEKMGEDNCREFCQGLTVSPTLTCGHSYDVVIIGSGMAGLGAAREIEKYNRDHSDEGVVKYIVLEGDNRICGRSIAANWIAGSGGNPIEDILWKNFGNAFLHHYQNWDDVNFVTTLKQNIQNKITQEYATAYNCAMEYSDYHYWCPAEIQDIFEDPGLMHAIETDYSSLLSPKCTGWSSSEVAEIPNEEDFFKFLLEWYSIPYEYLYGNYRHSSDNAEVSLWNVPDEAYRDYQDNKDFFLAESGRAAEICASEYVRYGLCGNIALQAKAKKVQPLGVGSYPIEITVGGASSSDCSITATEVISTLSVGALLAQTQLFDLVGSQDKITAMKNVYKVGNYYQFTFYFDNKFWNKFHGAGLDWTQFIAVAPEHLDINDHPYDTLCNWIQVMDTAWEGEFFPGDQALRCVITTSDLQHFNDPAYQDDGWLEDSSKVQNLFNQAVIPKLNAALKKADRRASFPSIKTVTRCFPPECGLHTVLGTVYYEVFPQEGELMGGSYSSWQRMHQSGNGLSIEDSFAAFKEYVKPLPVTVGENTGYIFFSGTATCPRHYEFVQGGIYSGIRDGKKALLALQKDPGDIPGTQYVCQSDCVGDSYLYGALEDVACNWGIASPDCPTT